MKFICDKIIASQGSPVLWSFENIGEDDWEHLKRGIVIAPTFSEAVAKVKGLIGPDYPRRGHNYNKHVYEFKPEGIDLVKDRDYPFLMIDWNHG